MYLSLAFAFIVHSCFPLARSLLHSHSHSPTLSFSLFLDRQLEWWRKTSRTLAHPPIYPILSLIPLYLWLRARVEIFPFGLSLLRCCISRLARIFRSFLADYLLKWSRKEKYNIITIGSRVERVLTIRDPTAVLIDRSLDCEMNDARWKLRASELSGSLHIFSCLLRSTMDSRGRWSSSSFGSSLPPFSPNIRVSLLISLFLFFFRSFFLPFVVYLFGFIYTRISLEGALQFTIGLQVEAWRECGTIELGF